MTWQDMFRQWNKEDNWRLAEYMTRVEYLVPVIGQAAFDAYIKQLERCISDREVDLALHNLANKETA